MMCTTWVVVVVVVYGQRLGSGLSVGDPKVFWEIWDHETIIP